MKLNKPKNVTFIVALVLGVLGILAQLVTIPVLSSFAFWLVVAGFVVLVLSILLKGF